ncbi:hypothetical protein TFKS16_0432 [Tannerella forsythia KS16]|uniref:Uncharacterized protein n=1 Tax=Tannerella forsythia (strain ATCC 43037 / JCM 10827 / CCUG 21028 A / KCTC 5666 / FDC 338) TaxID=203275 RepID=G8ULD0_TANFA|nr:hypothetical protein BFO_0509 [Tannerella forsythia 92A2]BAR48053.1 hypothetical protein TF3313_0470 [Tannerella forsythia 3313]BAR50745.1 hypothetical protein TFKS16_0432 [Tannerella forsythia KS16]
MGGLFDFFAVVSYIVIAYKHEPKERQGIPSFEERNFLTVSLFGKNACLSTFHCSTDCFLRNRVIG